jgi:hypothetical protein
VNDLIAFLAARLDEDEAAAKAVQDNSEPWPGQWEADGNYALRTHNGWVLAGAVTPGGEFRPGVLAHLARYDPARVLREVGAKRAILAAYQDSAEGSIVRDVLGFAVITYAAIWDSHPGYRQDWTEEEATSAAVTIPPEAVTAAMRAIADHHCLEDDDARRIALTALEAAMPLMR